MIKHLSIKYIFLLFLTFLFSSLESHNNYSFYQISLDKGLSQSFITSIIQDQSGNLWLGTKKGVNVFKQDKLITFLHKKHEASSLPSSYVYTLSEDSLGRIWAGTHNGLALFNNEKECFLKKYNHHIYSSYSSKEGLYFGGDNTLLDYDYKTDTLRAYTINKQHNINDGKFRINSITKLTNQKILIGTKEGGVYVLDTQSKQIKLFIDEPIHLLQSICVASDKNIYIATANKGLSQYTLQGKLVHQYNRDNKEIDTDCILKLLEYKGELWMCTDGEGIKILNLRTKELKELTHTPGNNFSIPTNSITTLYLDNNQLLWAGSVRKGAFCIKETYIRTFQETTIGNTNGLTESSIISLYEEENGLLWIGTDGGGINLFNPKTNQFKHFPSTYGDKIVSITYLNDNELLVYIYTKGMFIFNKKSGKYTPFIIVNPKVNAQECFYGYVPQGHLVNEDKIYIFGENCWIYRPSSNSFKRMVDTNNQPFTRNRITLADSNRNFSLLMSHNKVYMVNQTDDKVCELFELDEGTEITSLAYDQNHSIWVGTSDGLGIYDLETKTYKKEETNLFDSVNLLIFDGHNRLWIGAQSRLFSFEISDEKFIQINYSDGFIPNELIFSYQNTSKKHYIYLGGTSGLVQITSDLPKPESVNPTIELKDVFMNGKSIWNKTEKILNIASNYYSLDLTIQISTKDVLQQNLIRYSLVKNGRIQDLETYSTRYNFPQSLSPGKYSLMASCMTKSGDMTRTFQIAELNILPPWYRSTWFLISFYFGCIVIVLCVIIYYHYIKAKQVRKKMNIYKQHINEEKIEFLININHELRTPLTLIYAPLKRLMDKEGNEKYKQNPLYERLEKIYHQASNMYHIINTALDIDNMESNNRLNLGIKDINTIVSQTVDDLRYEAEEKGITLNYALDSNLTGIIIDEWKCQIILANILINAIKFSNEHTNIGIKTYKTIGERVGITVINDNQKLSEDNLRHIFDKELESKVSDSATPIILYHTKQMVESLGGKIDVYNSIRHGVSIYFELPIIETSKLTNSSKELKRKKYIKQPPTNLKGYSLLVVEDNEEMCSFLYKTLSETFKHVYTASNGKEGLEICYQKKPDIVISDVTMPIMNGFELCNTIKSDERLHQTIVILLTARCDEKDEKLGYKMGTDSYVKKPFDIDFLQTVMLNLLYNRERLIKETFVQSQPSTEIKPDINSDEFFLENINKIVNENLSNEKLNLELVTNKIGMSRAALYNKMVKVSGW